MGSLTASLHGADVNTLLLVCNCKHAIIHRAPHTLFAATAVNTTEMTITMVTVIHSRGGIGSRPPSPSQGSDILVYVRVGPQTQRGNSEQSLCEDSDPQ